MAIAIQDVCEHPDFFSNVGVFFQTKCWACSSLLEILSRKLHVFSSQLMKLPASSLRSTLHLWSKLQCHEGIMFHLMTWKQASWILTYNSCFEDSEAPALSTGLCNYEHKWKHKKNREYRGYWGDHNNMASSHSKHGTQTLSTGLCLEYGFIQ